MNQANHKTRISRGRTAIWQAKLMLLVMINLAQLWILSGTVEAALAKEFKQLIPLVAASAVCWLVSMSIIFWWQPVSKNNIHQQKKKSR